MGKLKVARGWNKNLIRLARLEELDHAPRRINVVIEHEAIVRVEVESVRRGKDLQVRYRLHHLLPVILDVLVK